MLDEPTLKQMAKITGAEYYHATSSTELTKIYQNLTTKLQKQTETTEISFFFVAGGLAFAVAACVLSMLWVSPHRLSPHFSS